MFLSIDRVTGQHLTAESDPQGPSDGDGGGFRELAHFIEAVTKMSPQEKRRIGALIDSLT